MHSSHQAGEDLEVICLVEGTKNLSQVLVRPDQLPLREVDPGAEREHFGRQVVATEERVAQPPATAVVSEPGYLQSRPDRVLQSELAAVIQLVSHGECAY